MMPTKVGFKKAVLYTLIFLIVSIAGLRVGHSARRMHMETYWN